MKQDLGNLSSCKRNQWGQNAKAKVSGKDPRIEKKQK